MAVDVPFESVQEITLKLARYEELFKYRYTEKDEGYRQTTQRPPRYVVSLFYLKADSGLAHHILSAVYNHWIGLVSRSQTFAGRRVWSTANIRLVPTPTPTGVGDK